MKAYTLNDQFLTFLKPEQKAVVWDYYYLITKPDELSDEEMDRIGDIWTLAENDEKILKWLEFIDYLYTSVDEADLPNEDKRAYLSEYLATDFEFPDKQSPALIFRILQCPHGKGDVVILWDTDKQGPIDSSGFEDNICSNCNQKYSEHTVINGQTYSPT